MDFFAFSFSLHRHSMSLFLWSQIANVMEAITDRTTTHKIPSCLLCSPCPMLAAADDDDGDNGDGNKGSDRVEAFKTANIITNFENFNIGFLLCSAREE